MAEDTRIEDLERRMTRLENGVDAIQAAVSGMRTDMAVGFATIRASSQDVAQERREERQADKEKPISLLDMRLRDLLILAAAFGLAGADTIMAAIKALAEAAGAGG